MKVRTPRGAIVLGCTIAALVVAAPASADMLMTADGLTGESNEQGFVGAMELESMQWGVARSSTKGPAFSEMTVSKRLDSASPALMLRAAAGTVIPNARVSLRRVIEDRPEVYLRYCLTGVRVTGVSQSTGGDRPSESLSLSYATIIQRYAKGNADGTLGTVFSAGWNVPNAVQILTASCD